MEFDVLTECTWCNTRTYCTEDVVEKNGHQMVVHFCKECYEEIEETLEWANNYSGGKSLKEGE